MWPFTREGRGSRGGSYLLLALRTINHSDCGDGGGGKGVVWLTECVIIHIHIYNTYNTYTGFPKHETTHTHALTHTPTRTLWGVWGDKHPLLDRVCASACLDESVCIYILCVLYSVFMCVVLAVVPVPIDNDNNNTPAYNVHTCVATTTTRLCVIRPERCIFFNVCCLRYYIMLLLFLLLLYVYMHNTCAYIYTTRRLYSAELCSTKTVFIQLKRIKRHISYS